MSRILYEDTIPKGYEYFSSLGEASAYCWQNVTPEDVSHADFLAVRSTTKVNGKLLSKSSALRYVTTATAGTNHIDKAWMEAHSLPWGSAGGCNAVAVAEYVVSVLLCAHQNKGLDLSRATVGIVGAGHVGTILSRLLQTLHIAYKLCDPPLQNEGDTRHLVSFEEVMKCDVVSLHIPFVENGEHATGKLIDSPTLSKMNAGQLLINACRGEVIDENALLHRLSAPDAPRVVMDVFWREPDINRALLKKVWLVTPHIAGHSIEGKLRGTQMAYEQLCERLNKPVSLSMDDFLTPPEACRFTPRDPSAEALDWNELCELLLPIYDVRTDDRALREGIDQPGFAILRKSYGIRREYSAHVLRVTSPVSEGIIRQLVGLGFILETL